MNNLSTVQKSNMAAILPENRHFISFKSTMGILAIRMPKMYSMSVKPF